MRRLLAALSLLVPVAAHGAGGPCRNLTVEETPYTVCEVAHGDDLRLFHSGASGLYGSFDAIEADLAAQGLRLGFAMNAGMYAPGRSPLGLYVEAGVERHGIVTAEGPGNFGMLPNGVFCVGGGFSIRESRDFAARPPECHYATQSGPMLVIDGALHPRFLPDSRSRYVRNGVGVSADGARAVFAISNRPVTFHAFARLFRDTLGLPNALYLDGSISRLYAPGLGRNDRGWPLGPIVGLVEPRAVDGEAAGG